MPEFAAPGQVPIRTWYANPQGNYLAADRNVTAPAWSTIEANYASEARDQLGQLM